MTDKWGNTTSSPHASQYQTSNFRQLEDIPMKILKDEAESQVSLSGKFDPDEEL
jgi:hypothetical protein